MLKKIILALPFLFLASNAIADKFLSADEIKILFTNRSYDVHQVNKDRYLEMSNGHLEKHNSDKGMLYIYKPLINRESTGTWWLDGDKYCTNRPSHGDSCGLIKRAGDGVYHGISDKGKHKTTYSSFSDK